MQKQLKFHSLIFALMLLTGWCALTAAYTPSAQAPFQLVPEGQPVMLFDPTGTRLVASVVAEGDKAKVVFLNVPDLSVIREIAADPPPRGLGFNRSGDLMAMAFKPTEANPLEFAVLETTSWSQKYVENQLGFQVQTLAFDPVGDFLLLAGQAPNQIFRYVVGAWQKEEIPSLKQVATGFAQIRLSPDAQFGALASNQQNMTVWPLDDTQPASTLGTQGFEGVVSSVAFSRDSQYLAGGDDHGRVMVYYRTSDDLWAWKTLVKLDGAGVNDLLFLKDQSLVVADTAGRVQRFGLDAPEKPLEVMQVTPENTRALALNPQGDWLAIGGDNIMLFPLGEAAQDGVRDMPGGPITIARKTVPDTVAESQTQSQPAPAPTVAPLTQQERRTFYLWVAPGPNSTQPEKWLQGWVNCIDEERFIAQQVILPYEDLTADVMRVNLLSMSDLLTPGDFLISYTSGVLKGRSADDIQIQVGKDRAQTIPLDEWIKSHESAAQQTPTLWFLDLRLEDDLKAEDLTGVAEQLGLKIALNPDQTKRTQLGVGLVTLSRKGCYPEISGNILDGLRGKADQNGDGVIYDRELVLFLGERCRTAERIQPVGDGRHELPLLPAFRLTN